jgi:membrane protease subunit HflC
MNAESLLEQKVSDGLRASFGVSSIAQVVSENRDVIMRDLSTQIDASAKSLGIEVVDVRIKRIDLPDEVSVSVFQRMRADRQRVAARHRADGEQKGEEIRAKADEESVVVVATAEKESRILRGQADANVTRIYGQAYSKDSDFYAFMRSLQAYENVFNGKHDMFVVSPDGEFFEFFKSDRSK